MNVATNKQKVTEESLITNLNHSIKFRHPQYTYQEAYSASLNYFKQDALAASTFVDKYALKKTLNSGDKLYVEKTPQEMHERLSAELARTECYYKFDKDKVNKTLNNEMVAAESEVYAYWLQWYSEFLGYLKNFQYIVPQGSPMSAMGNPYVLQSLSNCVVIAPPEDSWTGISKSSTELGHLMKARCGVGLDISKLRPDGAPVNNSAGTSTGAWSFSDHFSNTTRMIGQNNRRGALMITMKSLHPDIAEFVTMKRDPTKVTGANVSALISDEFMQCIENDKDIVCRWPLDLSKDTLETAMKQVEWKEFTKDIPPPPIIDYNNHNNIVGYKDIKMDKISGKSGFAIIDGQKIYLKQYKAKDIWFLINESAQLTAEPGLIFWDNYVRNLPADCYEEFQSSSTNPCSELALSPNDSCRLASINLLGAIVQAYTLNARFDMATFKKVIRMGMRIMDNIVDLEIEAIDKIINKVTELDEKNLWGGLKDSAIKGRRTGLGTHALADALAAINIKYDADEGNKKINSIYRVLRDEAYRASIELAKERGPFPAFDWEKEKDNIFINRLPQDIIDDMKIHGRRNIALLTNAPTGSVAIESQTSSGIEPAFRFLLVRRKKINPGQENTRVDFTDQNGDKWQEYPVFHHNVQKYFDVNKEASDKWDEIQKTTDPTSWAEALNDILPDWFVSSDQVDPMMRVRLQGTLQSYIDHGVSSTINLPKGTAVETIMEIYKESWKSGLKGVTVYVDGSRSGVLLSTDKKTTGRNGNSIISTHAPKRPRELPCEIHRSSVEGKYWTIFVGLLDGKPYEVFGGTTDSIEIPRRKDKGIIIKRKALESDNSASNSVYDLVVGEDEDDKLIIKNISSTFHNGDYAWATRLISQGLRHGISPEYIVQQLRRANDSSLTHFSKAIARVLSKYSIEDINNETGEGTLGIICKSGNCE